jgi:hypothetical protein
MRVCAFLFNCHCIQLLVFSSCAHTNNEYHFHSFLCQREITECVSWIPCYDLIAKECFCGHFVVWWKKCKQPLWRKGVSKGGRTVRMCWNSSDPQVCCRGVGVESAPASCRISGVGRRSSSSIRYTPWYEWRPTERRPKMMCRRRWMTFRSAQNIHEMRSILKKIYKGE